MDINYGCKIKIFNCDKEVNFSELQNEDFDISIFYKSTSVINPYISCLHNMTINIPRTIIACNIKEMIKQVCTKPVISYESFNGDKEIVPDDIIYIEAIDQYTEIFMLNEKSVAKTKLYEWDKILRQIGISFFRIHKSIIVNFKYIDKVVMPILFLSNGDKLKVSRRRKKDFNLAYSNYLKIKSD